MYGSTMWGSSWEGCWQPLGPPYSSYSIILAAFWMVIYFLSRWAVACASPSALAACSLPCPRGEAMRMWRKMTSLPEKLSSSSI